MPALTRQTSFSLSRSDFPDDFKFGTSTSAYQIEGSKFGGAGSSHWDTFATSPGNVVNFENGSIACDHYHKWQGDLDLMRDLGIDSYRFSSSWARVMPEGKGAVNAEGLDFYDRLVDGLLERNIEPHLTLYHWELPSALSDLGGWQNRDIADHFADYAEIMITRMGDRLESVATFNEPWCITWLSHYHGIHAPGLRDIRAATRASHHVLLSHAKAVAILRSMEQKNLGIVLNFEHTTPFDDQESSIEAARIAEGIYNRWFLGGLFKGAYPEDVVTYLEPYLPTGWQDDMAAINAPLDWLGINYYTRNLVVEKEPCEGCTLPNFTSEPGPLPKTEMNWEVYPQGLSALLRWISETHTGALPLTVTENGMANDDHLIDGEVDDQERIAYLDMHFKAALEVIEDGVPLTGYFVWSFMDNFEWALGYDKRFGIIHVDFDTLERLPKASYHAFKAFLA
ncbi:beta-glucosidase [Cohaesibacter sp. CAU 1516]|uniref:GH1 family beta-glucosidase n=1 Tax=Cohaesibacter sp. CAU 1516 TaxID=2576038 RepID=UPI0010FDAFA9|nr:GH1 family beta-glucosidase [Cohaesibacter sp. CAU 1516]TLP44790.1 beta-glucosidase [Cohaesibacter sp. CAU 1516]